MALSETQLMLSVGLIGESSSSSSSRDAFGLLLCLTWLSVSCSFAEKDVNADTLWVWCFPAVSAEQRQVLMRKCCLCRDSPELHAFVFGQYRRSWYYLSTTEVQEPTALTKVHSWVLGFLLENIAENKGVWASQIAVVVLNRFRGFDSSVKSILRSRKCW